MVKLSKMMCYTLALWLIAGGNANVSAASIGGIDPGAQMERDRRDMERERVLEQIAEDEAARGNKVEKEDAPPADDAVTEVSFELKKVTWNSSEILTSEEIQNIVNGYIGRQITLQDLREMTERITDLYKEKGYMTCGAVLPPQTIHEGVVEIQLIEGKTGNVAITGNNHTSRGYITNSLGLKPGEIVNTDKLNQALRWFHGTNDIQLRVVVKPGTEEKTTDYEIVVFEPQNQNITLYMDNDGYETSGRWRQGIFYNMRSLTGHRDRLRASYLRSQGTRSWSFGYGFPISNKGMKLVLDYSTNNTEVVSGELRPLGVQGKSNYFALTWQVPFSVTESSRHEAGLQYVHQTAKTELGHGTDLVVLGVNDKIKRFIPYVSFTHYGNNSVVYHKHSFIFANRSDISGRSETAKIYRLNSFWQNRYKSGQFLQVRLDGQFTSDKHLGASDRLFIGGVNSVRGYEEGFIGGEKGLTAGIEYHIPMDKEKHFFFFPFLDWGSVAGETAPEHRTLVSAGIGFEARYKNVYGTLTLGFPFKKDFYNNKISSARLDFSLSATF